MTSIPYSQISSFFILSLFLSKYKSEHREDGCAQPHPISQVDLKSYEAVNHPRLPLGGRVFSEPCVNKAKFKLAAVTKITGN